MSGDITINNTGVSAIGNGVIINNDINVSAGIVYSKLSLSNSIVNGDINSSAGIVYSKLSIASGDIAYIKLSLSNSIVNNDVNSSAGITESKLSLNYSTTSLNSSIGTKANDSDVVKLSGNQTISGIKSFNGELVIPFTGTTNNSIWIS
jgi:hypothetical protein